MYYTPYFPPDEPPSPPNKADLTATLKAAIQNKDIDRARWVFDTAFWRKIEIVPDWHHLLTAVVMKDRQMIKLLAAHGAGWTEEETRCLKDIFSPHWPEITATLRNAGVQINPGDPAQPSDIYTAVSMRLQILTSAKDNLPPEMWAVKKKEVDDMLSQGVIDCLGKGQTEKAIRLLRLRHPKGAVEFEREFKKLLTVRDKDAALDALDRLRRADRVDIKPFTLDLGIALFYPEAVAPLDQRKLLAPGQPNRMSVMNGLVGKADYNHHHRAALSILFKPGSAPLTESEADSFISSYQAAVKKNMPGIDRVCDDLKAMGFFDSPVWTTGRLRALSAQAPEHSSLKRAFNEKLAENRFRKMPTQDILKPDNFAAYVEAHRKGYYQAGTAQASDLLLTLQSKYESGHVPGEVKDILRALRDCGVRFGTHHYSSFYLGSKAPGMAKVLLDLGILKPENFSIHSLREKAGLPAEKDKLYWLKNPDSYAEFYFQVHLEQTYAEEFAPQRGKISSYHEAFKAKLFKKAPPPPPPPKPRKWFW
ncbi:MAG: hypothetical protein K8R48_00885 [Alphaproteobacteria bacterium]|nr:hypothetical protein [Alphaproteobacteria bacterium]